MSHRREQKEALRRERELREQQARAAEPRTKMVGYGGAAVLAIAVVAVAIVLFTGGSDSSSGANNGGNVFPDGGSFPEQKVFEVAPAAKAAGCQLQTKKGSGVATHTTDLSDRVKYNTNPPTTGRHYEIPADDGIYSTAPQDEQLVHNMEHGRVIIWVKPSLPEKQRADIAALVKDDSYQMVLVPRKNMPYAVAATAWDADPQPGGTGELMLCNTVNDKTFDALQAFRDEHRSQGPEPIP